jgi:hypothetical protein
MLAITAGITDEHLRIVYDDPGVAKCGFDDHPPAPVFHPLASYFSAWVGDKFAGAYLAVRQSIHEIELHSLLLKWVVRHSRDLAKIMVGACFASGANRVTALIYEGLEKTVNLCKRIGFVYEGFKRESVMIGGEYRGVHVLGVTRKDWGLA